MTIRLPIQPFDDTLRETARRAVIAAWDARGQDYDPDDEDKP